MKLIVRFLGIITALFFSNNIYSQQSDSLLHTYQSAANDTNRILIAEKLVRVLSQTNPDSSKLIAQEAYELSLEIGNQKFRAIAALNLGRTHIRSGTYAEGLNILNDAAQYLNEEEIDYTIRGEILRTIGNIYFIQYRPDEALKFYRESMSHYTLEHDPLSIATLLGNIGNIFYEEGPLDSALFYNTKAMLIREKYSDEMETAVSYLNIGMLYDKMDSLDQAIYYSLKASEIAERNNAKVMMTYPTKVLSSVYRKKGEYDNAIQKALVSLQLAEELNILYEEKDAHSNLAESYYGKGEYKLAFDHLKEMFFLNDTLLNEDANTRLAEMRAKYETEKAEQESELLSAQNILQRTRAIAVTSSLILVLVFVVFFYARLISKKKKENQLLEKDKIIAESRKRLAEEELENSKLKSEHLQKELTNYALHIVEKNEFIKDIKQGMSELRKQIQNPDALKQINKLGSQIYQNLTINKDREEFEIQVEQACEGFFQSLKQKHPELTPQERRLAALLRLNLTSKDISGILNISPKSVDQSRYRLRKKLDLDKGTSLSLVLNEI